jgi:Flp pilus assembly protein TadG
MFANISHVRCLLGAGPAMKRGMRTVLRNEQGAAIIELAIVAPIFALMTIGVVDMSNAYSRKLALEQGAQRAIEKIMQTTQDDTVEGTLQTEAVCQVNGTNTDGTCKTSPITAANVTVTDRLECVNSDGSIEVKADPTTDCAGNQTETRYISVTVTDKYTPMFPIHFAGLNADGTYHLSATAGMRTQ